MSAQNFGIKAIEIYFPSRYVAQADLEGFLGASTGKFTIGLGQTNMSFCDDREDVCSLALTAVSSLLRKYNINTSTIGRLEVGTESMIDKAKSCKSVLMQLFSPNTDIEGADTYNACYGGTSALLNAINWLHSPSWDGRDAIVVASDIATYEDGPARPTGGAGCVAMLLGANAPLVVEPLRASYMDHTYDFYKPDFKREYPVVEGHYSSRCYLRALDSCYQLYQSKLKNNSPLGKCDVPMDVFDYFIFHAPNCKQVTKAYSRLAYNDFLANPTHSQFDESKFASLHELDYEDSFDNKTLHALFRDLTDSKFNTRVQPSLTAPTMCGNMYTASIYSALASLISNVPSKELLGKRIGAFSFGSGLTSTLFTMHVTSDVGSIAEKLDLHNRLAARERVPPEFYDKMYRIRELAYQQKGYAPVGSVEALEKGTFYLTGVDEKFRRTYVVKE